MNRNRALVVGGVVVVMALVVYTSLGGLEVSCEVCITYDGRTECRTAGGASREEAVRTATNSACATLAGGMTESIRCESTPPTRVTCRDR